MLKLSFSLVILSISFKLFAAEVLSVYPTGSVKKVQQVVVKFSTDMIALGDLRNWVKDKYSIILKA